MRRLILPLIFGLAGTAVLIGLGIWQVQRLQWKEGVLAAMDAKIGEDSVPLPDAPTDADEYLAVTVAGRFTGEAAVVLSGKKFVGPGFEVIEVLETGAGRRVLIDRGFVPEDRRNAPRTVTSVSVTGNLLWPDESDGFTPPPDLAQGLWYARDVAGLSAALKTEPLLIVARTDTGDDIEPVPVDTLTIPNNHLNYAITWFSLAAVWLGMTLFWLRRIAARMA